MPPTPDPNLILGYVEDELDAAERAQVEARLAEDAALAERVRGMREDRAALRALPEEKPPFDLADAAIAQLERQMLTEMDPQTPTPAPPAPSPGWRIGPWLAYGGIAAVLALTCVVVLQSLRGDRQAADTNSVALHSQPGVDLAEAPLRAQRRAYETEADAVVEGDREGGGGGGGAFSERVPRSRAAPPAGPAEPEGRATAGSVAELSDMDAAEAVASRDEPLATMPAPTAAPRADAAPPAMAPEPVAPAAPAPRAAIAEAAPSDAPALVLSNTVQDPVSEYLYRRSLEGEARIAPGDRRADRLYRESSLPAQDVVWQSPPQYVLNVRTASPDSTLQQVRDWTSSQRLALQEADGFADATTPEIGDRRLGAARHRIAADTDGVEQLKDELLPPADASRRLRLSLENHQLDDLVRQFDRGETVQSAELIANRPLDRDADALTPQATAGVWGGAFRQAPGALPEEASNRLRSNLALPPSFKLTESLGDGLVAAGSETAPEPLAWWRWTRGVQLVPVEIVIEPWSALAPPDKHAPLLRDR
jgi:hypothetical protein